MLIFVEGFNYMCDFVARLLSRLIKNAYVYIRLQASGDPVACFDELSSQRYLPPPFQSRQYDPQLPSLVYVLLHDWCKGAALGVDPDSVLSQVEGVK